MKTAKVVIGANLGDEGKGLATDFFASNMGEDTVVVRFNGGSQAGHTVIANNKRHVFGHFGSGTMAGCCSHLSRFFISNPVTFLKELDELKSKGFIPRVTVSPKSLITTPFDIFINQISERRLKRNASCGLGINETMERSSRGFAIRVGRLDAGLQDELRQIATVWVPKRLEEIGITEQDMTEFEKRFLLEDSSQRTLVISGFELSALKFLSKVLVIDDSYLSVIDNIIFEGAQGLMLDQNYKTFPWVTHSNTGLDNVLDMFGECDLTDLDVTYVTRTYLTRHGNGPLANETSFPASIVDETNITNKFQGTLRYAPLDTRLMMFNIMADMAKAIHLDISTTPNILLTCCDQLPEEKTRIENTLQTYRIPVKTSYSAVRGGIR